MVSSIHFQGCSHTQDLLANQLINAMNADAADAEEELQKENQQIKEQSQ